MASASFAREFFARVSSQFWSSSNSIPRSTFFLRYINDLPDDVVCDIAIYTDDSKLCSKCDQTSDLWQKLELASELESYQRDTVC